MTAQSRCSATEAVLHESVVYDRAVPVFSEAVLRDAESVFEDVEEDFSTLSGVCRHFLEWRRIDPQAYRDAFVSLSLPKALTPLVRLQMLGWNPLAEGVS